MPLAYPKRKYADGGSVDINVTPSGSASGGFGTIAANSAVPAQTATQRAAYPTMPAPTAIQQPPFTPQPYSNSVANVPVGGTSGAPVSPQIAQIGANGVPFGSPSAPPTSVAQSALNIPPIADPAAPGAKRGGTIKKFAAGGPPTSSEMDPWYTRQEERSAVQPEGLVRGMAGGRTDVHSIQVPAGSYVMPADVVSGLAEGNTMAGSGVIDRMMHTAPHGINMSGNKGGGPGIPHSPSPFRDPSDTKLARGGSADKSGGMVPIIVAGGEHIIYPGTIAKKFGDLDKGHKILDKFVLASRAKNVKDIKNLKGPKK